MSELKSEQESYEQTTLSYETSPLMYGALLSIWGGIVLFSVPLFIEVVTGATTLLTAVALTLIVVSLTVFWLFGCYNIIVTLFGYLSPTPPPTANALR